MRECNLPNSEELEERACRCRTIAVAMRHKGTRQELLRVADEYDLMAQRFSQSERLERRVRLTLVKFARPTR
jgi:hypothetical protein